MTVTTPLPRFKLRFLPAVPGTNAEAAAKRAQEAADAAEAAAAHLDEKVNKAGDTMTGFLTLHSDPINSFHAATKHYVDLQDSLRLALTGGTLTGDLAIDKGSPSFKLVFAPATPAIIASIAEGGSPAGQFRWQLVMSDGSAESGLNNNQGSNFRIDRYSDAGAFLGTPLAIVRQNGLVLIDNLALKGTAGLTFQINSGQPAFLQSVFGPSFLQRWQVALGDGTGEPGSNLGNDFTISRYSDAGALLGVPLKIIRQTGAVLLMSTSIAGNESVGGTLTVTGGATFNATLAVTGQTTLGPATGVKATLGDNTAKLATTSFVQDALISAGLGDVVAGGTNIFTSDNYFVNTPLVLGIASRPDPNLTLDMHTAGTLGGMTGRAQITNWSNDNTLAGFNMRKARSGTIGTNGIVSSGDGGIIQWFGNDGNQFRGYATITGIADGNAGTIGLDQMPGRLIFAVRPAGAAQPVLQRMAIEAGGTVSIGTQSTPMSGVSGFLQLYAVAAGNANISNVFFGAAAQGSTLTLGHSRGAQSAHGALQVNDAIGTIQFNGSDGAAFISGARIVVTVQTAPTSLRMPSYLSFLTDNGTVLAERLRIWQSGGMTVNGPVFGIGTDPGAGIIEAEIRGTATASAGTAGCVGEFLTAQNTTNIGLVSGTAQVANSLTLTAGDWDVWAKSTWTTSGTAGNAEIELWTGTTISGTPGQYVISAAPVASGSFAMQMMPLRVNVAAGTTINLVARSGASGMGVTNSNIFARRRR